MKNRAAFTMIELIFVIVILGILSMVAIPRMSGAIDDANVAKAKSDVAALRSAIASERQSRFLQGSAGYISALDNKSAAPGDGVTIFDDNDTNRTNGALLTYGVVTGSNEGQWKKTADNTYTFKSSNATVTFTYGGSATGIFTCTRGTDAAGKLCKQIID